MRATVDNTKCQAHGVCVLTAPEVFGIGEADGYSYPRADIIPPQEVAAAQQAARSCPERAISIVD